MLIKLPMTLVHLNAKLQFQCGDGECIDLTQRCNSILDCSDASDENNCQLVSCPVDAIECSGVTGHCIPPSKICDGFLDCLNGDDEKACSFETCSNDKTQFYCPKDQFCIKKTERCDGVEDCESGEDEFGCDCSADQFRCNIGGGCINGNQVCDGFYDCPDSSDEWDCFIVNSDTIRARLESNVYGPVCSKDWSQEWSDEVCAQMNYLGQEPDSEFNETLQVQEFFQLNNSFSIDQISHVQEARSNLLDENCEEAINFECKDFACGTWPLSNNLTAKLAGEDVTLSEEERWQSLAYLIHVKDKTTCTVSIIGPRWLLTSHSCVAQSDFDPLNWAAVAGSSALNGDPDRTQIKAVNRIVSHPLATKVRGFHQNDIALIELTHNLDFDELVQPICLGDKVPQPGDLCIIAGWIDKGASNQGAVSFHQYLEHIPVPTVEKEICDSREHYNGHLAVSDICAGSRTDKPSCRNDTGAPLMCLSSINRTWNLVGILSHEGECLNRSHPDVFTSTVDLIGWISKTIGRRMS